MINTNDVVISSVVCTPLLTARSPIYYSLLTLLRHSARLYFEVAAVDWRIRRRSHDVGAKRTTTKRHSRLQSMADPWLAHEVLRELDEAGACYFPSTLSSQSLSTYLVSPSTTCLAPHFYCCRCYFPCGSKAVNMLAPGMLGGIGLWRSQQSSYSSICEGKSRKNLVLV